MGSRVKARLSAHRVRRNQATGRWRRLVRRSITAQPAKVKKTSIAIESEVAAA